MKLNLVFNPNEPSFPMEWQWTLTIPSSFSIPELKLSASELKTSTTRTQDLGNRAYDLSTTTKHLKALEIRVSVPELETNCKTKLSQQQMADLLN